MHRPGLVGQSSFLGNNSDSCDDAERSAVWCGVVKRSAPGQALYVGEAGTHKCCSGLALPADGATSGVPPPAALPWAPCGGVLIIGCFQHGTARHAELLAWPEARCYLSLPHRWPPVGGLPAVCLWVHRRFSTRASLVGTLAVLEHPVPHGRPILWLAPRTIPIICGPRVTRGVGAAGESHTSPPPPLVCV